MNSIIEKEEINVSKIYWAISQKKYAYNLNDKFACLFDYTMVPVKRNGDKVTTLGHRHCISQAYGEFILYSVSVTNKGDKTINPSKPLFVFSFSDETPGRSLDEFKQIGIATCFNKYAAKQKESVV